MSNFVKSYGELFEDLQRISLENKELKELYNDKLAECVNTKEILSKMEENCFDDFIEKYFLGNDNANEAIYIVQNGLIVSTNNTAKEFLEYDTEEIINKPFTDFLHPEDIQMVVSKYNKRVRGEKLADHKYSLRIITRSGKIKWVEVSAILLKWKNEPATLNFLSDITGRKLIENDLIKAKEQAEESNRLKTAFITNLSHEIRTPVNGIIGFSQFLSEPDLSDEERKAFIQIINHSCQRLLGTINDVLDISKIDSGQMEVNVNAFKLGDLFHELFEFHNLNFQKKNIELSYKLQAELKSVLFLCDDQKLYQIISNLLNNAYKFTNKGVVEYGCRIRGNKVEFYVQDSGIGIAPSAQDFIFGRFNQEKFSLTHDYDGAGLGLAISKGLVELLGGKIFVQSEKDVGSTFSFTLPLKTRVLSKELSINNEVERGKTDFSNSTILIAEDDYYNFLMLERIVTKELGAKVIHASNGKIAYEICKNHPNIALVLMDVKMPIMDGHTITKRIKKIKSHIPIIAVTAYSTKDDIDNAIAAGCDDYIKKPFKSEELIQKIKIWLSYFSN